MNKLTIDRFEGNYAVCEKEDKSMITIPKSALPPDCKEGECLMIDKNGLYQKDKQSYEIRVKRIRDKMKRLAE